MVFNKKGGKEPNSLGAFFNLKLELGTHHDPKALILQSLVSLLDLMQHYVVFLL